MNTEAKLRSSRRAADFADRLAISARAGANSAAAVRDWLDDRRREGSFQVTPVPFDRLRGWSFRPDDGHLVHDSGRFFAVEGVEVETDYGRLPRWRQPIINQTDIAILGILAKEIDGVLHFLMQAKMEPGNLNTVQLSPTVQATSSNYQRTHRGAPSRYLEYFTEPGHARVLVDVLQSEQGSWFRGKRNRNIVVETTADVAEFEDFRWLSLGEILALLREPHLVNMDTRTVLSCLPPPAIDEDLRDGFHDALHRSFAADDYNALHTPPEIESWVTARKAAYSLHARTIPLPEVAGWERTAEEIHHESGKYFRIIGVDVAATSREVASWSQPLLAPCGTGLAAFVVQPIDGVLHVLVHADLRPGYRDTIELGPTVQCTPGNFADRPAPDRPAYLDHVLRPGATRVHYDVEQSEEGGRFYQAATRHLIVESTEPLPLETPPDYHWMTARQLTGLLRRSYHVNIEARSLLLTLNALHAHA